MKMESVFPMASALLSMIVDQTSIVMNVETPAKKQTAMIIQMIHQFVLSVSDAFSHFSSMIYILRLPGYVPLRKRLQ